MKLAVDDGPTGQQVEVDGGATRQQRGVCSSSSPLPLPDWFVRGVLVCVAGLVGFCFAGLFCCQKRQEIDFSVFTMSPELKQKKNLTQLTSGQFN
ncbi:hypothetical protein QYF36_013470 [Acer negundo]|nr:hypothetical protein QYF36_013470 [Acer negundo]